MCYCYCCCYGFQGSEGNGLHYEIGETTKALIPAQNYVPWILVDGVHTDLLNQAAQSNLLWLVCHEYEVILNLLF